VVPDDFLDEIAQERSLGIKISARFEPSSRGGAELPDPCGRAFRKNNARSMPVW
jgi:hypothetical protein